MTRGRALRDEFFLLLSSDGQTAVDTRPGKNGAWMATRVAMMMAVMAALDSLSLPTKALWYFVKLFVQLCNHFRPG